MSRVELDAEQVKVLEAIAMERHQGVLADALAQAFPDLQRRLGEQYGAMITQATTRAAEFGLRHALAVARLIACWSAQNLGPDSDQTANGSADLLSDASRTEADKVFQLCLRVREQLGQGSTSASSTRIAAFEEGLRNLDRRLSGQGVMGSLLPPQRLDLGQPCDLDGLELRQPAQPLQLYQIDALEPTRVAVPDAVRSLSLTAPARAGQPSHQADAGRAKPAAAQPESALTALPEELSLLLPSGGRSRLQMRLRAADLCESHPWVRFNSAAGVTDWRTTHAMELALPVEAAPPSPGLAVPAAPQFALLSVDCCGLRASGRPLGRQATRLASYPSEQQLLRWQRGAPSVLRWDEQNEPQTEGLGGGISASLECDARALDASVWVQGLQALDQQLVKGLNRLFRAWSRDSGVTAPRMAAEPALLAGQTLLTWGYAPSPQGLLRRPGFRVAGRIDLTALRLQLALSGAWELGGARCQLVLRLDDSSRLAAEWDCADTLADLASAIKPASCQFEQAFRLELSSLASRDLSVLSAISPVQGKLVGSCGLRPRRDQSGLEWFAKVSITALSVRLQLSHPLLGVQQMTRSLLPATELVDWSQT